MTCKSAFFGYLLPIIALDRAQEVGSSNPRRPVLSARLVLEVLLGESFGGPAQPGFDDQLVQVLD